MHRQRLLSLFTSLRRFLCVIVALVGSSFAIVGISRPAHADHAICLGPFNITATAANTSGYITYIPSGYGFHSYDPIVVNQLFTSTYDPHPLGVWFDSFSQQWTIFNEDLTSIPLGTSFIVTNFCTNQGTTTFTATASNVSGDMMLIDNPLTNGNPNAVVYATQDWTGTYNAREIGVYYNASAAKWAIYNLDLSPMPVGASFEALLASSSTSTLTISASASNTVAGYMVYINDARFNNHPYMEPLLAQLYPNTLCIKGGCPVINNHPVGVWYDSSAGRWVIYNVDRANIPDGATFFIDPD